MSETYDDGKVICGPDGIVIRSYYFPVGTKRVPYEKVKGVHRFEMTNVWTGKWRIWGTGNPRYWANLDIKRPVKHIGFAIDTESRVNPIVTPDRPDEFESVLRARANLSASAPHPMRGPFI